MAKKIPIGIIGAGGNIGSALLNHLDERADYIAWKHGYQIVPAYVNDSNIFSLNFLPELGVSPKVAKDIGEILEDPEIKIIVETTGRDAEARDIILESFKKGKSVVTPNKLAVAKYMPVICEEARRYGQSIGFEASTMASVPVINTIRDTTDEIQGYLGIFNGTSNYVLTKMYDQNMEFDAALKEAQAKGFAEPDPSNDINGSDTGHKNIIATAISFGTYPGYDTVANGFYREGIKGISKGDMDMALENFGLKIKLLAKSKLRDDGKLEIGTYPFLISEDHELAKVPDNFNAIYLISKDRGTHFYKGKGAGKEPTRVPIADDIIRIATEMAAGRSYVPEISNVIPVLRPEEHECPFYLRFDAVDKPGVLSTLSGVLGKNNISISSAIQKGKTDGNDTVPVVFLTHKAKAGAVYNATREIDWGHKGNIVKGYTVAIRVEDGI